MEPCGYASLIWSVALDLDLVNWLFRFTFSVLMIG